MDDAPSGPLAGIRVVEMATVVAGPGIGRYFADYGADVVKIEPPGGDSTRRMGWGDPDDDSFFWKLIARNKRTSTIDLRDPEGLRRATELISGADLLVENMRPGKLESLGLAPDTLRAENPRLVVVRVSGFGQTGPYAGKPGFATLAEALSGLSAITGEADGPPLLPPIAITDELTAVVGAFASLVALRHADRTGEGQDVDVNLLESMFQMMGPLVSAFAHQGYLQPRLGSGIPYSVPRGTYRCRDGRWVAISSSADSVARRVLGLLGHGDDERFATFGDRLRNRDELEALMAEWVGERDFDVVVSEFERVDAAIAPILDMRDIFTDPHFAARDSIIDVDGITMQGLVARFSRTPGSVRHAGRPESTEEVEWLDRP